MTNDPVHQTLQKMRTLLQKHGWTSSSLLVNGKNEMPLKGLFGLAWEELDAGHAFVMDKSFLKAKVSKAKQQQAGESEAQPRKGVGGLDFVALEPTGKGEPSRCAFWVEFKASHLADLGDCEASATKAREQVHAALSGGPGESPLIIDEVARAPAYIVHFLTPAPSDTQRVREMYDRFHWQVPVKSRKKEAEGAAQTATRTRTVTIWQKYRHDRDACREMRDQIRKAAGLKSEGEVRNGWRAERMATVKGFYGGDAKDVTLCEAPPFYAIVAALKPR